MAFWIRNFSIFSVFKKLVKQKRKLERPSHEIKSKRDFEEIVKKINASMGELIRINKHLEDVRKNRLDSCNKIRIDLKEFGISKKEKKELSKKYKKDYDAYMILDNTILHGISELANILSVIAKKLERMGYPKEEYVGPVKALEQVIDKLRRYGRVVNDDCGIKA